MAVAVSDDHVALAGTAGDFLARRGALAASRALLDAAEDDLPPFWGDMAAMGWMGLHLPEEHGGSGFGLPELVVVIEQMGRVACPGPFVPSAIASATIDASADRGLKEKLLPGLAAGTSTAAVALDADLAADGDGRLSGSAGTTLGASTADLALLPVGEDVAVVDIRTPGVELAVPPNLDPARRAGRLTLCGVSGETIPGGRQVLVDLARLLLAAEAAGVAGAATDLAARYAQDRVQFGRPIATFQAVKHHCANMAVAAELAAAAVWGAARTAGAGPGGPQCSMAAAAAAVLAVPAAAANASLNIQVHGGLGFTWEHDAHLYLRRGAAIAAVVDEAAAARDVTRLARPAAGPAPGPPTPDPPAVDLPAVDLPAEAESFRSEARGFLTRIAGQDETGRLEALVGSGYAMPHWPRPWGRDAGVVEQLVIEQEFSRAGVRRPEYGITGWILLTLIQHATDAQVARWVPPALAKETVWCQLFSEPDAGSDAAGIKTRGQRVEGGWLVSGQKVWTTEAQHASYGLATVRTDPEAPKHAGITMMVIDMRAEGVQVRPLREMTGESRFNEVFLDDVLVPDDNVVGPVNGGWTVARSTLGNESVSIGSAASDVTPAPEAMIASLDRNPSRLPDGAERVGRYIARQQARSLLDLRRVHRAVAGTGPGPEGFVTKLTLSELSQEAAGILFALAGPNGAYLDGPGPALTLSSRALSIAGGTSEIKRNQIAERILGLPRDPLLR